MTTVEILCEQTEFLLEKQKEYLVFARGEFEALYKVLEEEKEKEKEDKSAAESHENVHTMIGDFEEELAEDLEKDITFLSDQIDAINKIKETPEKEKQEELVNVMLDKDHKLSDTEQFKSDVEAEFDGEKESLNKALDEIKDVLLEDGVKELEILLEAHMADTDDEEDEEDDDGCCGGDLPDCLSSCEGCCGASKSDDE